MADAEDSPAPRRSQREKKQAAHFVSGMFLIIPCSHEVDHIYIVSSALNKRKRSDETEEEDAEPPSDPEADASDNEDADVEDGFSGTKLKRKPRGKGKGKASAKPKGPPAMKKPRTAKKVPAIPKLKKVPGAKKGRKLGTATDGAGFDAVKVARDTRITGDNALYSAW